MKQIKNAMFAIAGGLLLVTVASVSCKKSSDDGGGGGTPAPVITSFTPTSAGAGATVTITGTDLTGATSVKFGGVAAASITSNTATEIKAVVGTGATGDVSVTTAGGTATKAGFTFTAVVLPTSNDIAPDFLVAHWTFDNNKTEVKSGLNPVTTGTTAFTAGLIGGATGAMSVTGTGANLVYPTIDTINKPTTFAGGFTLTMWAKIPTNTLYTSLFQVNGNIGDIF